MEQTKETQETQTIKQTDKGWQVTYNDKKYNFKTETSAKVGLNLLQHADSVLTVRDGVSPSQAAKEGKE